MKFFSTNQWVKLSLLAICCLFVSFYTVQANAVVITQPVVTKSVKKMPAPVTTVQAVKTEPAKNAIQAVAQVVWVKGDVKAIGSDKAERKLQRRGVIFTLDTIVTGPGSSGQIVFSDNTVSSLYPETQVKIEKYQYSRGAAKSQDKFLVNIVKGGFRTISGAIAKSNPDNYQVNTPVATIGVRGTQWIVIVKSNEIYMKIEQGAIRIETAKGSAVLDKASQDKLFASIDVNNPVPKVTSVSPTNEFDNAPPLTPASSTLPSSDSSSSGTGAGTTGGSSGGSGGGSADTDTSTESVGVSAGGDSVSSQTIDTGSSSESAPSTTTSSFCIQ